MASVTLEDVRKVYDSAPTSVVVRDVSLRVADGEFVVLVGPSGCGKTTTLRMIAGLESVTAGRLLIDDRLVNDVAPKDRDIAMVFQNYALYPHMTVRENMAFALVLRKLAPSDIAARVAQAAEVLGLTDVLDRTPKELSGGQRQRVAIGRAIVRQPRVFLFDEPLSNLDAKLRLEMRREIARLHRELGATMIYVTHDQVEAMTLGDRIAVMNRGAVQQVDAPRALYDRPANRFVATFIGSPAMNMIDGLIERGVFRTASGALTFDAPAVLDGRRLTLGVRPEHLVPLPSGRAPARAAIIRTRVELIEPLGSEVLLHVRSSDGELTARVAPDITPPIGTDIDLALDLTHAHYFDPSTEQRIPT
ncbi:MAG TPA: sn-glycerol-3-phosphate ABC transporter ATP-binding protein UgpC [Gemmatimonadaceae bacterium]|nr:sn-glycerol-3-phosphate ABC transporter ATP-binding protein UgpC [Gemmatimonadaceae bacterium]